MKAGASFEAALILTVALTQPPALAQSQNDNGARAEGLSTAQLGSTPERGDAIPQGCTLKVADMLRISRGDHVMVSAGNCSMSFN